MVVKKCPPFQKESLAITEFNFHEIIQSTLFLRRVQLCGNI
jgi:hypothetical protein